MRYFFKKVLASTFFQKFTLKISQNKNLKKTNLFVEKKNHHEKHGYPCTLNLMIKLNELSLAKRRRRKLEGIIVMAHSSRLPSLVSGVYCPFRGIPLVSFVRFFNSILFFLFILFHFNLTTLPLSPYNSFTGENVPIVPF